MNFTAPTAFFTGEVPPFTGELHRIPALPDDHQHLGILLAGAAGTQLIAPFLDGPSPVPLASAMLGLGLVSLLLIGAVPAATGRPPLIVAGGSVLGDEPLVEANACLVASVRIT